MTWSDAARKAAIEARRNKAKGGKTWANKGYKGTVNDQIRAMTPAQRAQTAKQHPWLMGGSGGNDLTHPTPYQQPKTPSAALQRYRAARARRGR